MDNKLLLVKCATLLYRESLITDKTENSQELVRTVLEAIKLAEVNIGVNNDRDIMVALKSTVLEMCNNPPDHEYDKTDIMQRFKLNTGEDEKLYESIAQGIEPELTESSLKRTIINMRKAINNHFREQKIEEILTKASNSFKFQREKIKNVNQFVGEVCGQLEPYQMDVTTKDPGIVSEVDIGDEVGTSNVFKAVKELVNGNGIMSTGYQGLNDMTQGGFRRGEFVTMFALQHNNKTGHTLELFKQIALYNKPYMLDPTKKPLLLRISFEDDLATNVQFIYKSLKENETGQKVILDNITEAEMSQYIKEKLQVNGYHVKMMRVDPTQWTYRHICNKVLELEAEGYELHLLMLDYLAMVPTTGCAIGPMGSDLRDMFRRMRNFCNP